jgi:hypothetical protein
MGLSKSLRLDSYKQIGGDTTNNNFVFSVNTANAGVSNNDQFKLPLFSGGIYDFTVEDWGDGTSDNITVWNDPKSTHTYPAPGIYEITISGQLEGWRFNNGGDKLKILTISNWGTLILGTNQTAYFSGCTNLDVTASDELNVSGMSNLQQVFSNCQSLSGIIRFNDTSNIQSFRQAFYSCFLFNHPLTINSNNCITFYGMFFNASLYNQDMSNWDIPLVSTMEWMLSGTNISNDNYSNTLIGWNGKAHQNNVKLHSSAKYTLAAAAARNDFIVNHLWQINDGGPA